MKELQGEMSFIEREKAYCNGWHEIYTLSNEYFQKISSKYSELLKQVTKDLKKDVMNLQFDEWQNNFDKSCELMEKVNGVSELKKFISTPIYNDEIIAAYETKKQAYDAGKYQAFYKVHTVLFNTIEALSIEASSMDTDAYGEMKLNLSGAMDLLTELSSITGFEILGGSQV